MQVPQLQFAQVPVMQLPSEMQGFSNALLQAGQMRQNRLQQAEALARQQEQQQFENQMATQRMGLAEREFAANEKTRGLTDQVVQAQVDAIMSDKAFNSFIQSIPPEISELSKTDPIAGMQQTIELYRQSPDYNHNIGRTLEAELKDYQKQQAAAEQQEFENKLSLGKFDLEKQKLGLMQQEVSAQQQANALKQQADQRDLLLKGFENADKQLEFNYTNLKQQQATLASRENHLQDLYNKAKAGSLTPTEKEVISSQFNFVFGDNNKPEYNKQLMGLIEPELNRIKAEKMRIESQAINVISQRNKLSAILNQLRGMPNLGVAYQAPYQVPGMQEAFAGSPFLSQIESIAENAVKYNQGLQQINKQADKAGQRKGINLALKLSEQGQTKTPPLATGTSVLPYNTPYGIPY